MSTLDVRDHQLGVFETVTVLQKGYRYITPQRKPPNTVVLDR